MPLEIIRNDITKVHADAIVNAANTSLLGGGGVDGAIHRAAGPDLLSACQALGGCAVGQAKITKGYRLPAKHVIHTVGPIWEGGNSGEEKLLADCYASSLALAKKHGLESIAFPLISSGAYGYPKDRALKTAISAIGDFLLSNEMTVYLVVFDKTAFALSAKLFASISQYIDDKYVEEHPVVGNLIQFQRRPSREYSPDESAPRIPAPAPPAKRKRTLDDVMGQMDETFSQMLLRLIDEKGMTDAEAYKTL